MCNFKKQIEIDCEKIVKEVLPYSNIITPHLYGYKKISNNRIVEIRYGIQPNRDKMYGISVVDFNKNNKKWFYNSDLSQPFFSIEEVFEYLNTL